MSPSDDAAALSAAETVQMLKLFAAQIEDALVECDAAIANLLQSFALLTKDAQWLCRHADIPADGIATADEPTVTTEAMTRGTRLVAQVNAAIHALQFHDRLSQRLSHVRHSLTSLGEFVSDPERSARTDQWEALRASLGRLYRTREEVAIFNAVMERTPVAAPPPVPARPGCEIELF